MDSRKLSAVEVRVLSRLLDRAQALPAGELEGWLASLPEAQQALVPRLRERLAQIAQPQPDAPAAPPPPLAPVRKVDPRFGERVGPYRLVQELGTSGEGLLWQAEFGEAAARQTVALMLPAEAGAAERQIVSLPEHANLARLQDAGIDERGRPYRVMRWVEGVGVLEHAQRRRMGAAQRVLLLLPVCEALAQAHADRVAHGDIRAANLRVDDDGRVTLLDWGKGRMLLPASAAADLLGLARVLAQLLDGASSSGPAVADLRAVLQRSVAPAPADRYASVDALMQDLRRVLDHRPVPGPHATPWHRGQLFLRRHRMALTGGACAVIAAVIGANLLVGQVHRGEQQVERADRAQAFANGALPPDVVASAAGDPAVLAPRLQRALEQTRMGFDGEPVLRGQVLTELALRFRALGQPEQALAVLREATTLLQGTAAPGDPALALARAHLAAQLLEVRGVAAAAEARTLVNQVLTGCAGAGCEVAKKRARELLLQPSGTTVRAR